MRLFSLYCLILVSLCATGQQKFTMNDCMRYAVQNGYSMTRAMRNVDQARVNYSGAIARHLPSLSASVGAGSGFGRGIDPLTNIYSNTTSFSNNYSIGVSLPVFNAGYYINNTLNAKLALAQSKSELEKAQADLAFQVIGKYVDLVYAQGLLHLTCQRVEKLSNDFRLASRKVDLGGASIGDAAQFESSLAMERVALINRQNEVQMATLSLKEVMNFPIHDTLLVDTSLVINVRRDLSGVDNVDHLPQAEILEMRLKAQRYALAMARSGFYPSISASGNISSSYNEMLSGGGAARDNFARQLSDNFGQSVSIGMSIPIFSGLSTRNAVRRAKIACNQAQSDYDEQMRALRIEIARAVMDLNGSITKIEASIKAVQASFVAHRANERKYEQGMISVMDLQKSANELLLAQVELIWAKLQYELKSRSVAYYMGEALIK